MMDCVDKKEGSERRERKTREEDERGRERVEERKLKREETG